MNSNISGNPNDSNILNSSTREVDNNVQLVELLRKENEQLESTVEIIKENQRNTDIFIEQNIALIQKMVKEQDQLEIELSLARGRERSSSLLLSEQLSTHNNQLLQLNNKLENQQADQLNAHQDKLKQLMKSLKDDLKNKNEEIEEFRTQNEEKNAVLLQNLKECIEQKCFTIDTKVDRMQSCLYRLTAKFVLVIVDQDRLEELYSNNVEIIEFEDDNNFDCLDYNISSYRKELLIQTDWEYMNTTSECAEYYAKLLSLCKEWKRLRPDGEIHCLCSFWEEESPSEPSDELASLLTTCNNYLYTDYTSNIPAIRHYWPKFSESILSEKTKYEYPA